MMLAYEMNGQPLPIDHGAPLRLRVETQLGFTMVKYIRAIEFVETYAHIGKGRADGGRTTSISVRRRESDSRVCKTDSFCLSTSHILEKWK